MSHVETIEQLAARTERNIGWIKLRMHSLYLIMISIIAGSGYWLQTSGADHSLDIQLLFVGTAVVLLLLCLFSLLQCHDSIKQLQITLPFFDLRIDLYQAHKDALGDVVAEVLPNIRRLGTEVSVLEEMLRDGDRVTARYAALYGRLTKLYGEAGLAKHLRELIRISLQAEDARSDATSVTDIVSQLIESDGATIHPLTRK